MSASKGLSSLLRSLLDSGITIDDGRERIVISTVRTPGRTGARGVSTFTIRTTASGAGRSQQLPASAFTPTGKVSSRKLFSIIAHFPDGISKAGLAKRSGVARRKLATTLQKLTAKGLISERAGKFYPAHPSHQALRPSRRRQFEACTIPGCRASHYARGLCNNHYNSQRRNHARQQGAAESLRRGTGSFKDAILTRLREGHNHSLFELARLL
ncbi:MAG: hypothetical protein HY815_27945, partial [Candidatus Riflebacteria bacterium]|nr:hypothetical protein [Candidatus Riflebacteria bacterium]